MVPQVRSWRPGGARSAGKQRREEAALISEALSEHDGNQPERAEWVGTAQWATPTPPPGSRLGGRTARPQSAFAKATHLYTPRAGRRPTSAVSTGGHVRTSVHESNRRHMATLACMPVPRSQPPLHSQHSPFHGNDADVGFGGSFYLRRKLLFGIGDLPQLGSHVRYSRSAQQH